MSTTKRSNKLFHAVVILGASMTGGVAAIACGSSGDSGCIGPNCGYAQIGYNPDAYAHISDASGDSYAHIGFNGGDAQISDSPMDAAHATDAPPDADDAG
jgi:hypothetical protein